MATAHKLLIILIHLLLISTTANAAYRVDDIPNVHLQDRSRYVTNPDGVISSHAQAIADSIISGIWKTSTAEVAAVVIDDFEGDDIDTFATELFSDWGIGKNDKSNGVLLFVAKDRRKAVIRTGYGVEGVLPDVVAGRILRKQMFPRFQRGDYDGGVIAALSTLSDILNNPDAVDEIISKQPNDARASSDDVSGTFFTAYLFFCGLLALAFFIAYFSARFGGGKLSDFERYNKLEALKNPALVVSFLGLGLPLLAFIPIVVSMKRLRNRSHSCSNCGATMRKLDEVSDNAYLTPAQDMEEQLNSVDYDVWVCPRCNATDIYPFINKMKNYTVCENCGARTCALESDRTLISPTQDREGKGVKTYRCLNCHNKRERYYTIAKLASAVPIIIGGRGSGGGGGGFSGGSFGGGFTGGGGASGGW